MTVCCLVSYQSTSSTNSTLPHLSTTLHTTPRSLGYLLSAVEALLSLVSQQHPLTTLQTPCATLYLVPHSLDYLLSGQLSKHSEGEARFARWALNPLT